MSIAVRLRSSVSRKNIVSLLVAAALVAASAVWAAPASGVTCGKYVHETTPSSKSNLTAYYFSLGKWVTVSAAWGQVDSVGTTGSCQDVNHRNNNKYSWARAAYYSTTYSRWAHGSAGWVTGGFVGTWIVTITNLPNGTSYRPGTDKTSTDITVAT